MLGRLLAEWGDRPVGCLFLLPLWNPVLVAEQIGTLASLTDAPFIVQTGIGSGAAQFAAMRASMRTRGRVLEESVSVIKALLVGEPVDPSLVAGEPSIALRPHQRVEWWIGAGAAPAALERAGRIGDAWYGGPNVTLETAPQHLAIYRESCAVNGRDPRAIMRRDVIVLTDGAAAEKMGAEIVAAGYRGMGLDQVVVGSPASVAEQFAAWRDLGFDDVIVRCMTVPQHDAMETIENLAEVRALLA
jgi:alkanesulfonate monooxygenase SsuD/methylene tetrahydromethanopterin reductase-like flavin-dependent oxidoreductase (luciferase family)